MAKTKNAPRRKRRPGTDRRARDRAATPQAARAALNDLMRTCAALEVMWQQLEKSAQQDPGALVALESFEDRAGRLYGPLKKARTRIQQEQDQGPTWTRIVAVSTLIETAQEHFSSAPTDAGRDDEDRAMKRLLVQVIGSRRLLKSAAEGAAYSADLHRAALSEAMEQYRRGEDRDETIEPLRWALAKANEETGSRMKTRKFAMEALEDIPGSSELIRKLMSRSKRRKE